MSKVRQKEKIISAKVGTKNFFTRVYLSHPPRQHPHSIPFQRRPSVTTAPNILTKKVNDIKKKTEMSVKGRLKGENNIVQSRRNNF